jgi:hypothetical protein
VPNIRGHPTDAVEGECGREKSAHGLVVSLGFGPDDSATSKAFDEGPEDVRMGVLVVVLDEDVLDGLGVRDTENVMMLRTPSGTNTGYWA